MKRILIVLLAFAVATPFLNAGEKIDLSSDSAREEIDFSRVNAREDKTCVSWSGGLDPYWSMHPVVKVLSNGRVIVMWEEGESVSRANIVYRTHNPATGQWSPALDQFPAVAVNRRYSAGFPQVLEDREGTIHISYHDGNASANRDTWYAYYKNGVWTNQIVLMDRPNSAWPRLSYDPETDDLYMTWQYIVPHPEGANYKNHDSEIVVSILRKGSTQWTYRTNYSCAFLNHEQDPLPGSVTIHQDNVFSKGRLYGLFMDGDTGDWTVAGQDMPRDGYTERRGKAPVNIHAGGYWPEIAATSTGDIYGTCSFRSGGIASIYKPYNGEWRPGPNIGPGHQEFLGLAVAKNDVAYAMTQINYADGFLPVAVRFTKDFKSPLFEVDDTSRFPIRMEIDVDYEGNMHCVWTDRNCNGLPEHCQTRVWYRMLPQEPGGPTVNITDVPATIITKEQTRLSGQTVKVNGSIVNHTWYIHKLGLWENGKNLDVTFQEPGFYEIHYFVADNLNRMGHKAITVEVIDAPFQPTEAGVSESLIRGFFLRRYINELSWKTDARNDNKFENLTHFNIYRRQVGETEWGTPYTSMDYVNSDTAYTYRDESPGFATQDEAAEWQYAVTVVAEVSGSDKESKKTVFSRD
ncbi:MAG TPA: hypothetical protein ENN40_07570 [Candidatus Aminicenantes bacterium]|nr:hypothetical protein [Candidatus Aminicenantes bacterium]